MVTVLGLTVVTVVSASGPAVATVGSDRAQITTLEQRIAAQGARVEALVARSNAVQGQIAVLDVEISADRERVAADQRRQHAASSLLRGVAVSAYMTGVGMGSPTLSVFTHAPSVRTAFEQNSYLGAANSKVNDELNTLDIDRARTERAQRALRSKQDLAKATLDQLANARRAATAAIASDEAMLNHVNGNLRSLLAAASARRHAAELAAERALATRASAPEPPPVAIPVLSPPISPAPTSGTYANPFRGASVLSPERIDQGVDYSGFGPIYAIGNGVVLSTVNGGWPGGTFIAYRLTDGPANGLVVFAAEDIQPAVQVGQSVTANTVVGQMYAGPSGIETGWADPSANGDTMARTYGQFGGGNSTAFGYNFSQLLQSVGAPGGILQNNPPSGSLPPSWPHW
jgi:murein DD-endopeptidase MepM/ murein hydrolase activator NlpD